MSIERMQTIIDVSLQGVDRSIAEARRLSAELGRAVQGAGGRGTTAFQDLAASTVGQPNMNPSREQPGAFNPVERAQAQQLIATRNANNALSNLTAVYKDRGASAKETFRAEQGALRAQVALDAAIERSYKVQQQFDPILQQRLAAEKASAALAKQRNAAQQKQVMDEARATERAGQSLDRQRNMALQKQVMDEARDRERAAKSLERQRSTALQKQVTDEARATERAAQSLERQRNTAQQKQVMDDARERDRATQSLQRQRDRALAKQVADEERDRQRQAQERERAAQSLDRQRNSALQKQVVDDAKERENATRSLQRQRDRALAKQVAEEEAARLESERRARTALTPDEVSKITASPLRMPGDTDRVYKARTILAEAQTRHAIAESKLADATNAALNGDARSRTQLRDSLAQAANAHSTSARSVQSAEQGLATAIRNETLVHAQNTRRSLREDFITGFRGRGQNPAPYGEQIGQALKFSVFYGTAYKALFALTQTLQATFQEGVAFQQGMTDLAIATGRPKEQLDEIATNLAASATRAGFAPSQGIQIGARSLGLYGATESDQQTQDRVMAISSRVVNQLAVGSGKQPVDLQGDIAAIAQALGGGAAGQFRIADLDAYMTKKFGVQQGATLDVVGQSASVGKAAGFSDEQLFAIAADLLSRTGQSGSAVAGYMAQIFSRGGEGSLVDVARKQGIDPTQDLASILGDLAKLYQGASNQDQATISAAFGRGKVQNAAVALLADYNEVLSRADRSRTEAPGQADEIFSDRMKDIGGELQLLQGALRDFASQLGESGLLDVVGLSIVTFRELLEAANGLLRIWNALPNAAQDVIVALGLLAAATRSGAAASAGTRLLQGAGAAGQFRRTATGVPVFVNEAGQASRLASREGIGGIARAGRAALGMIGPIGLAVGGLLAIGEIKSSMDQMRTAQDAATQALLKPMASGSSTPAEMRTAAAELKSLANENREATSGFFNALTFGQANDENISTAKRLEAEASRLTDLANRAEANQAAIPQPDASVFRSFNADDLSAGLKMIEESGGTATEQLAALRDVLYGTADAATAAEAKFDPQEFAGRAASQIQSGLAGMLSGLKFSGTSGYAANQFVEGGASRLRDPSQRISYGGKDLQEGITAALTGPDAQQRLLGAMDQYGVDAESDIDADTAAKMGMLIGKGVAKRVLAPYTDDPKTIRRIQERINGYISDALLTQTQDARALVEGTSILSPDQTTAFVNDLASQSESRLGGMAQSDTKGRATELRSLIRDLTHVQRARTDEPNARLQEVLAEARRNLSQLQFDELENLRRIAQRNASSKREIASIGQSFLQREITAAVRGGNADLLVQILEAAGKGAVNIAKKAIEDSLTVMAQARKVAAELADFGNRVNGVVQGAAASWRVQGEAASSGKKFKLHLPDTKGLLDAINNVLPARGDDNVYRSGSDSGNPLLDKESGAEKDTPAEIAAARAAAYATRSESGIAAARASVQSAKASLAKAKKNTVEYWNAMGELFGAQNELTDAVQAYRLNQMRLRSDMTDPLAQARIAVREAAMRLRSDRGKGADVIAADKVALRDAQANRESTAFSQRLQAVQTADELGRISHSKYISYLEHEKSRLEGIKNRTFQQQDQLNQIDRLMQDAAKQMQGQWNLGDIKLPTPYQVRRYVEEKTGAREARLATSASSTTVQNNNWYFNGADTGRVKKIVEDTVGKAGRTRTTQPRRR